MNSKENAQWHNSLLDGNWYCLFLSRSEALSPHELHLVPGEIVFSAIKCRSTLSGKVNSVAIVLVQRTRWRKNKTPDTVHMSDVSRPAITLPLILFSRSTTPNKITDSVFYDYISYYYMILPLQTKGKNFLYTIKSWHKCMNATWLEQLFCSNNVVPYQQSED